MQPVAVRTIQYPRLTQITLTAAALARQQMAQVRLLMRDLARLRELKALRSAPVGLHLRHKTQSSLSNAASAAPTCCALPSGSPHPAARYRAPARRFDPAVSALILDALSACRETKSRA